MGLVRRIFKSTGGAARSRAERHLRSLQVELEALTGDNRGAPWLTAATSLVEEGARALETDRIEHCWHFVNAARRHLTFARSDDERALAARVLLIEAGKMSPWRRASVEAILNDSSVPTPAALREAMWLRDDFYENRYHRIDMQREQLRTIVIIGAMALASMLLVAASSEPLEALLPRAPWHWRVLVMALSFGVLGASFGAARTITVNDLRMVIPELTLSKWITWARMLLGATLGLAAYVFLLTGLVNFGDLTIASAAAAAFVGGFSEQVLLKVIGTIGERDPGRPKE